MNHLFYLKILIPCLLSFSALPQLSLHADSLSAESLDVHSPLKSPSNSTSSSQDIKTQPLPQSISEPETTSPSSTTSISSEGAKPSAEDENTRFYQEFFNMLSTLGIIIALILIATWVLKRLLNTRMQQINTTSNIKILEKRNLAPKATLYLLEVHGKKFVVAETPTGISYLTDIHPNPSLENLDKNEGNAPASFDKILQEKLKRE